MKSALPVICNTFLFIILLQIPAEAIDYAEPKYANLNDTLYLSRPLDNSLIEKINTVNRLFDSLDIVIRNGNFIEEAKIRAQLANHFRLTGNYTESVRFYREAMNLARQISTDQQSEIHHGLASVYYEMYFHNPIQSHYLDSAKVHADIAYNIAVQTDNRNLIASALNVQGAIEVQRANYESAIHLLEKAMRSLEGANPGSKLPTIANISYAYMMTGKYQKALDFAEKGYISALNSGNTVFAGINLENLVRIYKRLKNTQTAQHYQKMLSDLEDEKGMMVQSLILKQQLLNHQIRSDQDELSGLYRERFILFRVGWILVGGFVLLLVLTLVLFHSLRQHKRIQQRDAELKQEREHADQLELENTALELKAREAEAKALQVELESRNNALASKLLSLSKVNEFLSVLQQDIRDLSAECDNKQKHTREQLANIDKKLSRHINQSVWEEFEMLYASGNSSFVNNITKKHPDLTTNDKRLCYLILADLTTNEISDILSKSYRSVEMARHRLRNRLGLDSDSSLRDYLLKYVN